MRKTILQRVAMVALAVVILSSCSALRERIGQQKVSNPYTSQNQNRNGQQGRNDQGGPDQSGQQQDSFAQDQSNYYQGQGQGGYNQGGYNQGGQGYNQGGQGYNQGGQGYNQGGQGYNQGAPGYNQYQQPPRYNRQNDYAENYSQPSDSSPVIHVIHRGDTIYALAKRYGVRESEIRRWNNISGDKIDAGDRLRIYPAGTGPAGGRAPAGASRGSADTSRVVGSVRWRRPTQGDVITEFSSKSLGVDFAGRRGQPVYAVADGVVEWADSNPRKRTGLKRYGRSVMIQHSPTYLSLYAFLSSVDVRKGQKVSRGQLIGRMGGGKSRSYLHFEIRKNGNPRDPFKYLP